MPRFEPSELYSLKYCQRIEAKKWRYAVTPPTVQVLFDHFKPTSVIDVGCANGLHLKAFKSLGVQHLLGIEGTIHWSPYIEKHFDSRYKILDLRDPLPDLGTFDLILSFEVLEHLEKEFSSIAVDNLTSLGDTICCSACPIRGGFHHFNPQPKSYWIEKFERRNFLYCEDEVNELQQKFQQMNCSGWFKTGLKVFRRNK